MRTLVIGDIHGRLSNLLRALENAGYAEDDKLIFLGDYIDKPSTKRSINVIDYLLKIYLEKPDTIFLRGNHEAGVLYQINKLSLMGLNPWEVKVDRDNDFITYSLNEIVIRTRTDDINKFILPLQGFMDEYYAKDKMPKSLRKDLIKISLELFRDFYHIPLPHREFYIRTVDRYETSDMIFKHSGFGDDVMFWNSFETKNWGKFLVCGHYHAKFIGCNKICLALDYHVPVMDIGNMTVWDSAGNTTILDKNWFFQEPFSDVVDIFCDNCNELQQHKFLNQNITVPELYIKRWYTCLKCSNSILR